MFNINTFYTPGFLPHKCDPNIHNEQYNKQKLWYPLPDDKSIKDWILNAVWNLVYQQVLIATVETEPTTVSNVFRTTT